MDKILNITRASVAFLLAAVALASATPSRAQVVPVGETEEHLGRRILAEALDEAKAAKPDVRAKIWLEAAKQLDQDKRQSEERAMLLDAYAATVEAKEPEDSGIGWLQSEILQTMMQKLGPEPIETLLPKLEQYPRALAFDLLVTRFTNDKNWDQAMQTLQAAPKDQWFPFAPATQLFAKLPQERSAERRTIFLTVFAICKAQGRGFAHLDGMIEQSWRELPREEVADAIPRILREAIFGDSHPIKWRTNFYQQEKPKLLPIWKELEPAKEAEWEANEKEILLEEQHRPYFSVGVPNQPATPAQGKPAAGTATTNSAPATAQPAVAATVMDETALRKPRAVMGCMEDEPWCQSNRLDHALAALKDHLLKHEMALAQAEVTKGFGYARSQWRLDTDPADPNQTVKVYWPSTTTWEMFSVMATRVSTNFALRKIAQIPDPDIRALAKVILARLWLDNRPFFPCPSLHSKYHNEGPCVSIAMYMPRELFDLGN
jgi:hypothetical protein